MLNGVSVFLFGRFQIRCIGNLPTNSPGLSLELDLADAFFDPQIAASQLSAAQYGESGATAQVALRAAELYFNLLEDSVEFKLREAAVVPLSVYDSVPAFEALVASALQVRPEIKAAEAQVRADVSAEVKQALDAIVHSEKQFKVLTRAVERIYLRMAEASGIQTAPG